MVARPMSAQHKKNGVMTKESQPPEKEKKLLAASIESPRKGKPNPRTPSLALMPGHELSILHLFRLGHQQP